MDIAYWFYKLATKALLPLPVLLLLLVIGVLIYRRRPRLAFASAAFSVLVLIVLSLPISAHFLLSSLERQYPATSIDTAPDVDLIILLTGGVDLALAPRQHAELGARGDRVLTSLRLLQAGKAPRLLVAGKNSKSRLNIKSEGEATISILTEMGADPRKMSALAQGRNTRETATILAQRFTTENVGSVLLVTSAFHMPRSMQLFANLAPKVIPFTANHLINTSANTSIFDLIPSAISLSGSTLAINEYLGMWISHLVD